MKYYDWSPTKNEFLKTERDICFEDVVLAIREGGLRDVLLHPNHAQYPNQRFFIIEIQAYIYVVPFVEDDTKYFLKTVYPSRKLTKHYLKGERK